MVVGCIGMHGCTGIHARTHPRTHTHYTSIHMFNVPEQFSPFHVPMVEMICVHQSTLLQTLAPIGNDKIQTTYVIIRGGKNYIIYCM